MLYAMPYSDYSKKYQRGFVEFEYLSDIKSIHGKKLNMSLQGGMGLHHTDQRYLSDPTSSDHPYFLLRASASYHIPKFINLHSSFSLRGWDQIQRPVLDLHVMIPFHPKSLFEKKVFGKRDSCAH
jgi:hypothetical protein